MKSPTEAWMGLEGSYEGVTSVMTYDQLHVMIHLRIACSQSHVRRELVAYLVLQKRAHIDRTMTIS